MKKLFWFIVFIYLSTGTTQAQLTVQGGLSAQQLANILAGPNITPFNAVVFDTFGYQTGSFNYIGNDLGLNNGIILSTGDVMAAVGPNTSSNTTSGNDASTSIDSLLSAIANRGIADLTYLEFEFEAIGDEISFNYIFLSEDYNQYIFRAFNDAFAFTISGPGIVGEENIALIPNVNLPITTANVNNNLNWQYFVDNDSGTVNIEFDGFTTLLTARKTGLQPCGVYKLTLKIADGQHQLFDSGVMIQANSLTSNAITAVANTYSTDTTALEGCIPASYTFDLGMPASQDLNIPIRLGGTALNGVDYELIDSIITIPAGQSSSTLIINALSDGLIEGQETIELYYRSSTSLCVPEDTARLYIDDATPLSYTTTGTNLSCNEDQSGSIMVNILGGSALYSVNYSDVSTGLTQSIPANALPISNLNAATYALQVYDQYGCTADAIVSGGLFDAGQTFLPDGTGVSYTNDINISGFNGGQNLSSINQINSICATLEHSYAGDLGIELIAPNGTSIQLKGIGNTGSGVYTCNLGEPVASGPTDAWSTSNLNAGVGYQYCWTTNPTYPQMNAIIAPTNPGPPPTYTYTTLAGNTYTDYYLPAGSYTPRQSFYGLLGAPLNGDWRLKITDYYAQDNGYLFNWSISLNAVLPDSIITLTEPPKPTITATTSLPTCGLSDGSINLSVSGFFPPYTYLWNTGSTNQNLSAISAGIYIVTVTDNNNCSFEEIISLSNTGILNPTAIISPESCSNTGNGMIDLTMGGGAFNYTWSNGAQTQDISNLTPNNYSVTIDDGATCLAYANYIVQPATALVSTHSLKHENCGDREGEINIAVSGGIAPYSYLWSNGIITQNISDLQQGSYEVTITDANGCLLVESFNVINLVGDCIPNCDLTITTNALTPEACGNNMGSIDVQTFTTAGSVFFHWSNGAVTEDVSNLPAGNYNLTVEDAGGCIQTENYTIINQTNGLTFPSIVVNNETCGDSTGVLRPLVYGGVQPYSFLWSNGSTQRNLSGLTSGNYTCTVTDDAGCLTHLTVFLGSDAHFSLLHTSIFDDTCDDSIGSIDILLTSNFDYRFIWSNGATTEDLRNIPSGIYSCTVTDDDTGCKLITPSFVVNNQSADLQFNYIDIDQQICNNGLGEIDLIASGGTAPYTYNWSTGSIGTSIDSLHTGIYGATVTDSMGCSISSGPLNIGSTNGSLTIDGITIFDEHCNNNTGAINLQVSGNNGTLSFLWNTGSNSKDLSNLSAGIYTCTISDALGCSISRSIQVNNNSGSLQVSNAIITHENCSQSNAAINLIVTGGILPINYQWSNGATTQNLSSLRTGLYTCTITDAQGCQLINTFSIQNQTGNLSASLSSLTNEICGDSTGSINLSILGGDLPLSYLWSNGNTSQNIAHLNNGTYTCTITDNNSCALILGPYFINNSSSLREDSTSLIDESCSNQNGSIDISIRGGLTPYSYQWSNSSTTEDQFNLNAGTYTCTITDAEGCQLILTKTINNTSGTLSILNAQIVDELCSNSQGAINLVTTGGILPLNYQWSNGAITEDIAGLNSGNYICTITDNNNCTITTAHTVANNAGTFQISSPTITDEQCGNGQGSVDLNLINGVAPYSYEWSNNATTLNLANLSAGIYTQTITDNNNCVLVHSVQIQNTSGNLLVQNDSITNETCNNQNGSINLTISGGTPPYSYQWSNGATTQNLVNLSSGIYTCVITDQAGCYTSYSKQINNLGGDLQIENLSTVDNNCEHTNGAILASVIGGDEPYNFTWGTPVNNLCGHYTLNMYSNSPIGWTGLPTPFVKICINGIYHSSYTIPANLYYATNGIDNSFRTVSFSVCQGDSIRLALDGVPFGLRYELLDGEGRIIFAKRTNSNFAISDYEGVINTFFQGQGTNYLSGLNGGNYTLTVTDTNGCSITQSTYVNTGNDSLALLSAIVDEHCADGNGEIDLSLLGSINPSYLWSNGSETEDLDSLTEGIYSVTVSDLYGCSISDTYSVFNNSNGVIVTDTIIIKDSCLNNYGAIDLTITGGQQPYTFQWNNGRVTEDILGLSSGIYSVTISDLSGCNRIEEYYVDNATNGMFVSSNRTNISCITSLGAIDLSVTGGIAPYTYLWSNGDTTEDISSLAGGNYICSITDATNCTYIWHDTINQGTNLYIPNLTVVSQPCNYTDSSAGIGGGIYLSALGGVPPYNYLWNTGATTPDLVTFVTGTYTVTITDSIGCQLIESVQVEPRSPAYIADTVVVPDVCNNNQGSIDLTVNGGFKNYLWSTGATSIDIANLAEGDYTVTISSVASNGGIYCIEEMNFYVPNSTGTLQIDSLALIDEICTQANGSIDLSISGGIAPYSYQWSNGAISENLTIIPAGIYSVTITDSIGCIINSTNIINNITYGLGISGAFLTDEQCGLDGAINILPAGGQLPYTYNWSNGDTTQNLTNISGGIYYVTLTENNGCQFVDSFVVNSGLNALSIGQQIISPTCGLANGSLNLIVNGGSSPYTYQWSNGFNTASISSLSIGNYSVTISDMNGCIVTLSIPIVDTSNFVNIISVDTISTSCNSCSDGAIHLNLDTLGAPYTFLWDNGETTEDVVNLIAGTYFVTITNIDGCTLDTSFVISTSVGLKQIPSLINAKVYPNPSDGDFVVEFNSPLTEPTMIHIYNNLGQVIYTRKMEQMDLSKIIQIELKDCSTGIYFLQLTSKQRYFTQRIIID